jgi:integrase/recombinase XerD
MSLNPVAKELVNLIRRHRLDYNSLRKATFQARQHLHLKPPKEGRKLPHLLTQDSLKRFYQVIDGAGNLRDQIMLRLLFYTSIRVHELVSIKIEDVDLGECKIYIEQGKGKKDRYVLFPESFKLTLQAYLQDYGQVTPYSKRTMGQVYMFESRLKKQLTTRRVHQIVVEYAQMAEIPTRVHPHLFRHQMLSWLTKQGLPDSKIQLVSGHSSKKSLEVYQHMSLEDVSEEYQAAVRKLEI